MSGFAKLEARIDALRWLADVLDAEQRDHVTLHELRVLRGVLSEARDLVRPDYVPEPEPEEPAEPEDEQATIKCSLMVAPADARQPDGNMLPPIEEITGETARLARAVVDESNDARDVDGEPIEQAERWDAPTPAPAGVIRAWAQKQGITCPAGGMLSAALLNIINDRRRMLRLRPFVQSAAAAGGAT